VPSTDLLRHASGTQKFFTRYIMHGMLRFTRQTRTITQAGAAICTLATGDKFKGLYQSTTMLLLVRVIYAVSQKHIASVIF